LIEEPPEKQNHRERQPRWSESIAVGNEKFVRDTKERLGAKAVGRDVIAVNGSCELRETATPYRAILIVKNDGLSKENAFFWEIFS
jgi:hypothetical protein